MSDHPFPEVIDLDEHWVIVSLFDGIVTQSAHPEDLSPEQIARAYEDLEPKKARRLRRMLKS